MVCHWLDNKGATPDFQRQVPIIPWINAQDTERVEMMVDTTQSLEELVERIQGLVTEKRWQDLSEIDETARATVEQALSQAREQGEDEARVRALIEQLVELFDQARRGAEQERDEAELGLRDTSRTQRAANAYLNNK